MSSSIRSKTIDIASIRSVPEHARLPGRTALAPAVRTEQDCLNVRRAQAVFVNVLQVPARLIVPNNF